jgi:dihydrolipoamide dehydrogenase
MPANNFDVLIIGGGPGGYVAAIRAAQLGMKVALIERESLGGVCLNWGCIPTKSLLRSAEIYDYIKRADEYGVSAGSAGFDIAKIVARSRQISDQLSKGVQFLLKKNKVPVFRGDAKLSAAGSVSVETADGKTESIHADHIIIATGARARQLPGLETDGRLVWSYREALVPEKVPESLLVIGSGAIGMEFASFYRSLGSRVTVVEVLPRLLPVEDHEISGLAEKAFQKRGMDILLGASVTSLTKHSDSVVATVECKGEVREVTANRVIAAVGVTPNSDCIGLEATGVALDKNGFIKIDGFGRTTVDGIYAIGDVAGAPCLAHKASHEGVICVENIAEPGKVLPLDKSRIPGCTYCHPQVASVGLTQQQASEQGYDVRVGRFPFAGNGKAIALGESDGLVKTVFDAQTGELLGVHMIGAEVTELISAPSVAQSLESTEADLMHTVFAHPTLSEMLHESVLDAFDKAIHI